MTIKKIKFHFILKNEEGQVLDSSYDSGQNIEFISGNNELTPYSLEKSLLELEVGQKEAVSLPAADAFGLRDDKRVIVVPIEDIRLDHENQTLERGMKVFLGQKDENEVIVENELQFTITAILNGMVTLDGNHPLADLNLIYEIELLSVEEIEVNQEQTQHS